MDPLPSVRWPTPTWWYCRVLERRTRTCTGCGTPGSRQPSSSGPSPVAPCWASAGLDRLLARTIDDAIEPRAGTVAGLDLLPVDVRFHPDKRVGRATGSAYGALVTTAYQIQHGVVTPTGEAGRPFLDGCRRGSVWGTSWHGAWESDDFRRACLRDVVEVAGRDFVPAPDVEFASVRAAHLDLLGDLVAGHLDTVAVDRLIRDGAPVGLPGIPPGAPA